MITTVLREALRVRGGEPAVLGHTGSGARTPSARLRVRPGDRLVDLDAHPMGTPVLPGQDPEAGLVAVVAATPTDLHRTLTTAVHLPRAAHVLVALLATPAHQEPPLPSAPGLGQWHDLQEARVRRVDRNGWVCELFFPRAVEPAEVLDTVAHGMRGRRRGAAVTPLAALHGTEGALWRPGDAGAHGVGETGPVPLRRVTPVADLALRVGDGPRPAWTDPDVPALEAETTGADAWSALVGRDGPARARDRVRARGGHKTEGDGRAAATQGRTTEHARADGAGQEPPEPEGRVYVRRAQAGPPVLDGRAAVRETREEPSAPGDRAVAVGAGEAPPVPGARAYAREGDEDPLVHTIAPIDELTVNPTGFTKAENGALGEMTVHGDRAVVREGGRVLVEVPADGTVTDVDLTRLRHLRGVRVDWSGHTGPTAAVRATASLAAGGVPLFSGPVPTWAAGLGRELAALITGADEQDLTDRLRREEHSVRLRRSALDLHGTRARWRALSRRAGVPVPPEPTVSVVLCTRRPEMVGFALAQIARQRGVRVEVVLALHGFGADRPEVAAVLAGFAATGLPLTVHEAGADRVFGAVLNDAVARAGGDLIAKWDDDDWYGPRHLADLLLARRYSGAELVGTGQDFVFLQEIDLTVWRSRESETTTRFIAGGTILLDRVVLEETGGFRPLPRAIDTQLLIAVARGGGRIHRTHGLGYVLRRTGGGHTWSEDMSYFLHNYARQWSGWRPSALLEGEPAPLGAPATTDTTGRTP